VNSCHYGKGIVVQTVKGVYGQKERTNLLKETVKGVCGQKERTNLLKETQIIFPFVWMI